MRHFGGRDTSGGRHPASGDIELHRAHSRHRVPPPGDIGHRVDTGRRGATATGILARPVLYRLRDGIHSVCAGAIPVLTLKITING